MTMIGELAQSGYFLFLIAPAIVLVTVVGWLEERGRVQPARRSLLVLLAATALALASLDLLMWTNPAGRSISSSPPALCVLPALVALLASLLRKFQEIIQLWKTDRLMLAIIGIGLLVLTGVLWLGEPSTFYVLLALAALLSLAWWIGTRTNRLVPVAISLVCLASLIYSGGGAFSIPGLDGAEWQLTVWQVEAGMGMLLAIFLSCALFYKCLLEGVHEGWRGTGWRMLLAMLLIGGSAYMVYWDGVWSAAHARVFEDHLPLAQFLLAVMAGAALGLALSGWRRLAGLAFVLVVCAVAIQAFLWGWNVSAFALTERRAERVNAAIERYYQANGRYPENLTELTPRYLLYLAPPVVVRLGGWCYQGGQDFYRLGYVSGQFSYERAAFEARVFDQVGNIPTGGWNCDQMVTRLKRGGLNY